MDDMGHHMNGNGVSDDPHGLVLESHEDRLQKVETVVNETRAEVAATGVRVEAMQHQLVESNSYLLERMEAGFKRVSEKMEPLQKLDERVEKNSARIDTVEKAAKARAARNQRFSKSILGLGAGAVGFFGLKIGEMFWAWLSR